MMLRGAVIVCQVFDFIDLIYRYGVRDGVIFHGASTLTRKNGRPTGLALRRIGRGSASRARSRPWKSGGGRNGGPESCPIFALCCTIVRGVGQFGHFTFFHGAALGFGLHDGDVLRAIRPRH